MPNGNDRADLLTAGLSVQLPLFSKSQKSQTVRSIKYKQASVENKRLELLQKVRFDLENMAQQYRTTLAQRQLYENQILPTLAKQKESAIQSYESDKGDFRVVTDLYLKEQSTKIKLQRLQVNEQILISKMNYWLRQGDKSSEISQILDLKVMAKENEK
jgi:outer membrane protein TolC